MLRSDSLHSWSSMDSGLALPLFDERVVDQRLGDILSRKGSTTSSAMPAGAGCGGVACTSNAMHERLARMEAIVLDSQALILESLAATAALREKVSTFGSDSAAVLSSPAAVAAPKAAQLVAATGRPPQHSFSRRTTWSTFDAADASAAAAGARQREATAATGIYRSPHSNQMFYLARDASLRGVKSAPQLLKPSGKVKGKLYVPIAANPRQHLEARTTPLEPVPEAHSPAGAVEELSGRVVHGGAQANILESLAATAALREKVLAFRTGGSPAMGGAAAGPSPSPPQQRGIVAAGSPSSLARRATWSSFDDAATAAEDALKRRIARA